MAAPGDCEGDVGDNGCQADEDWANKTTESRIKDYEKRVVSVGPVSDKNAELLAAEASGLYPEDHQDRLCVYVTFM